MSNTKVDVSILGRRFTINTPESEKETLIEAVDLLNNKISLIAQGGQIIDHDKMVIMAALNITHSYLKLKVTDDLEISTFERKMRHMIELCDEALGADTTNEL
ncbi:cell division protein ZapA [Neisseria sp. Ec49-e6-T10]|uniref:cell division protein ZapA n=1 Tax=Neisseria sp. Ec49-e6-T10 TaxID=3140744 RepID=UPI003EB70B8D